MRKVRLKTPITDKDLEGLELGDAVYLDGIVYTGREGVYNRAIGEGIKPPVDLKALTNVTFHCSPAAAVRPSSVSFYSHAPGSTIARDAAGRYHSLCKPGTATGQPSGTVPSVSSM